jgi:acyl-CoA synthetase (AMP-forming)/AMP-acid ligase II
MTESLTIFDVLAATATRFPDRPFLHVLPETAAAYGIDSGEITYAAILERVTSIIEAYVRAGYREGDRVGLLLENRPAFFEHWFALNAIGVSVVPINSDLRSRELEYLLAHSEICAAVVLPSRQRDIATAARGIKRLDLFGPDETIPTRCAPAGLSKTLSRDTECALLYTSGTTGQPKGCVLTNAYFHNSGHWYVSVGGHVRLTHGMERMITPLPLFHMNAMATSTMTMLMIGGCLTVLDRFHPKTWWQSVRETRATILHYLGVMPAMLMRAPMRLDDRNHSVRFGFGAGCDRRLHAAFEERFGFPLIEAWAMTETGGGVVIAAAHEPRKVGTNCFGKPGPECVARIVADDGRDSATNEPGELLVRRAGTDPRHGFFREYLKDPEATAEAWSDDWFRTGDIVKRDADGHFTFVDRRKNVIRRSGENVSAVEVESIYLDYPSVAAIGVSPVFDDVRGEEVFACVVIRKDIAATRAEAEALVTHAIDQLAYYKAPGYVAFVDALPVTATQKIQRGTLKVLAAELVTSSKTYDLRHLKKRIG